MRLKLVLAALLVPAGVEAGPPESMRFLKTTEPNERAFTVLIPAGWKTQGGIVRVDPNKAGGPMNSIEAKCDFAIRSDAAGTRMIRFLPNMKYIDLAGSPVLATGMFRPGSNYNGMTYIPKMGAAAFLERIAMASVHGQLRNARVKERKPLPALAETVRIRSQLIPFVNQMRFDGAMITVEYEEGGNRFEEKMAGVVVDWGQAGMGLWEVQELFLARTPVGQWEASAAIFSVIRSSVEIDPVWLQRELQGQAVRNNIVREVQNYTAKIDAEIAANRRKTNEQINHDMFLTLTGQEEYVNPHTKKVELGSNEWKYRWQNASGEIVYSNREAYNPNQDVNINRSDYKRSEVKPRR